MRKILWKCLLCSRRNAHVGKQLMADLPEGKGTPCKPLFFHAGLLGPFYVRQGRSTVKRFGCIFTCLAMRATQLEAGFSSTTNDLLMFYVDLSAVGVALRPCIGIPLLCRQRGRIGKGVVLRRPWSNGLGSTRTLVTLLRPWIRRFTMIISAWWLRTNSKFREEEFEEIHRNIGSSETPKQVRM